MRANTEIINREMKLYFDEQNSVGLGELLLFTRSIEEFVESEGRRDRLLKAVVDIAGYDKSAREFVKLISYEDFKKRKEIGEITALGLKLYLKYQCGADWERPFARVVAME